MNQKPTTQVTWGIALGALVTIGSWLSEQFAGVPVPGAVQGAIHTFIVFGVQYVIGPPQ